MHAGGFPLDGCGRAGREEYHVGYGRSRKYCHSGDNGGGGRRGKMAEHSWVRRTRERRSRARSDTLVHRLIVIYEGLIHLPVITGRRTGYVAHGIIIPFVAY